MAKKSFNERIERVEKRLSKPDEELSPAEFWLKGCLKNLDHIQKVAFGPGSSRKKIKEIKHQLEAYPHRLSHRD